LTDLVQPRHVLVRLGQRQFQAWLTQGRVPRLSLLASAPSEHIGASDHTQVTETLATLRPALPAGARVTVLADSKWMPLSLLNTGAAPLSMDQVQALARHRFSELFGEPARTWQLRCDYLSGQRHTLAFACPPELLHAIQQGITDASTPSVKLSGLQPTLEWAWNHVWRLHASRQDNWLLLAEHDRSVLAHVAKGAIRGLHAAAPVYDSPAQIASGLPVQALHCGIATEHVCVLGVSIESRPDMTMVSPAEGVRWHAAEAIEVRT
jgi:hypothetical protein